MKRKEIEKQKLEIAHLEELVFGSTASSEPPVIGSLERIKRKADGGTSSDITKAPLPSDEKEESSEEDGEPKQKIADLAPAWVDDDDLKVGTKEYATRLRQEHSQVTRQADWAQTCVADDQDYLRTTKSLVEKIDISMIEPDVIKIGSLKDANFRNATTSEIKAVEFHNSGDFLFAASGPHLRLFETDGKENAHLQSIKFESMSIEWATFGMEGNEIIACGKKKTIYSFDLPSGKIEHILSLGGRVRNVSTIYGLTTSPNNQYIALAVDSNRIIILSQKSKQYLFELQQNTAVYALEFSRDSTLLYTAGKQGDVYVWDMKHQICTIRYNHHGATKTTSIAICPKNYHQALGADNGVVSLYKVDESSKAPPQAPQLWKEIFNLTTTISDISFNHDSQLMAICSKEKENAVRLVNMASGRVYSNWPNKLPVSPSCVSFSPDSSRFAIGTTGGRVMLWRLHHYNST